MQSKNIKISESNKKNLFYIILFFKGGSRLWSRYNYFLLSSKIPSLKDADLLEEEMSMIPNK